MNSDIAPTIAAAFGASLPGPVYGAPIRVQPLPNEDTARLLDQANAAWTAQARSLRALPYIAGVLAAFIALISIGILRTGRVFAAPVLVITFVPFVLVMSNSLPIAASLLISALGGAYVLRNRLQTGLLFAGSLVAGVIFLDAVFTGGQFVGSSLLGYSPLEGARYYGIGNEAMGALVGGTILITAWLLTKPSGREWFAVVWLAAAAALAWPTAGAKAGGLLVGFVALAALYGATSGRSWRDARVWGGLAASLALGIGALFLLGRYGAQSHLTQTVQSASRQGNSVYGLLVLRKALMDSHLVFHSVWIWVLLASSAGNYALLKDRWRELAARAQAGVMVGGAAAAACLTLNDAGVVAAAVSSLSLWAYCIALRSLHADLTP